MAFRQRHPDRGVQTEACSEQRQSSGSVDAHARMACSACEVAPRGACGCAAGWMASSGLRHVKDLSMLSSRLAFASAPCTRKSAASSQTSPWAVQVSSQLAEGVPLCHVVAVAEG